MLGLRLAPLARNICVDPFCISLRVLSNLPSVSFVTAKAIRSNAGGRRKLRGNRRQIMETRQSSASFREIKTIGRVCGRIGKGEVVRGGKLCGENGSRAKKNRRSRRTGGCGDCYPATPAMAGGAMPLLSNPS